MDITQIQLYALDIFFIVYTIIYGLNLFGISAISAVYLDKMTSFIKLYISLFLLWRFNIFRKVQFTELDRKIVFNSALFLFATTTIDQRINNYFKKKWAFFMGYI